MARKHGTLPQHATLARTCLFEGRKLVTTATKSETGISASVQFSSHLHNLYSWSLYQWASQLQCTSVSRTSLLATCKSALLEKRIVARLINFSPFIKHESSLPCSKELTTDSSSRPINELILYFHARHLQHSFEDFFSFNRRSLNDLS
jgi:hypothetical protein